MAPSAAIGWHIRAERPTGPTGGAAGTIALLSATLSIAIGITAIAGWSFGLPALTQFYAARSAMQPITAVCSILAGTAILLTSGTRAARLASVTLATLIVIAAVQTLAEYGLGVKFGTDDLLFGASVEYQAIP